ncbi:hypothetical protein V5O48_000500 [Marasmius crinis-equi]|uniref:Uncharacterized protein n=1 Tax=Marasmius crinis-equi TaxID=585013 RepID=A0ABR3G1W3_9AGAR
MGFKFLALNPIISTSKAFWEKRRRHDKNDDSVGDEDERPLRLLGDEKTTFSASNVVHPFVKPNGTPSLTSRPRRPPHVYRFEQMGEEDGLSGRREWAYHKANGCIGGHRGMTDRRGTPEVSEKSEILSGGPTNNMKLLKFQEPSHHKA